MKIYRIFISGLILLLASISLSFSQNAASILDKAANAYKSSGGMKVEFSVKTGNNGSTSIGTIDVKGDKFMLNTPEMITWYDGRTQWSYVESNEEVSISAPSGDELHQINPLLLLSDYKKNFTAKYIGESTAPGGQSAYDIILTPKRKGDITEVSLQINKTNYLPASIVLSGKTGTLANIKVKKINTGINQPDNFFVFDKGKYPQAEIVDLR